MDTVAISQALKRYATCDIADALLKLKHPHGGYLPGLTMWSPTRQKGDTRICGPTYTVKFVRHEEVNAPKLSTHHIDTIPKNAVIFLSAPSGTRNAVYGGLMSHRAKFSGAVGTVVDGVFRDLQDHRDLGFPVFARNVATPAYHEVVRPSEINIPVKFQDAEWDVTISPGDYIVGDLNGVICVPEDLAESILETLPAQVEADELMAVAIAKGSTFVEASKRYRKK